MSKKKQEIGLKLAHADMAYIYRLEEKVDFLMKKQVERDMKDAMGGK
jgi:transcriptional regulator